MSTTLEQIGALLRKLDEREQLTVLTVLIQGGDPLIRRSEAFTNALMPVDDALSTAWHALEVAADDAVLVPHSASFGMHHPDSPSFGR